MGGNRILVVEREAAARTRLAELLSEHWSVSVVDSGEAALLHLDRHPVDLVLLGAIGRGPGNEALLTGLARRAPRPRVILLAPAFCREVLERAAILDADGVLESRDEEAVVASVTAHLGI